MVALHKMESKFGTCIECKKTQGSTSCDKCRGPSCPSCVCIIPKKQGEVEIRHKSCIRGGK